MKTYYLKIMLVLVYGAANCAAPSKYWNEFVALENNVSFRYLFNKNTLPAIKQLQRDIPVFQELSLFDRILRFQNFFSDCFIVTKNYMPLLYDYIYETCKHQNIKMPTVFIATDHNFLNAFALKLFTSSGSIAIGKDLLFMMNEKELQAIINHEIGHIKHNHVNKMIALNLLTLILSSNLIEKIFESDIKTAIINFDDNVQSLTINTNAFGTYLIKTVFPILCMFIIPPFLINKKFEKEADEFAYKIMHSGEGLKQAFEKFENIEKEHDCEFTETYNKLIFSRQTLDYFDFLMLSMRFYINKIRYYGVKWIKQKTPYGAHPSPSERIEAIIKYQKS